MSRAKKRARGTSAKSAASSPYVLTLDLRVLDHLGLKLYSNAAAVLSEAVANSWDADAARVEIAVSPNRIVLSDDGVGMDLEGINERFLSVGYNKRTREGEESKKGRPFMGRKGIGKLALFSLAERIEVHTKEERVGKPHAFLMETEEIRNAIRAGGEYRPIPIAFDGPAHGTRIVLTGLKRKRTAASKWLRRRIARRFSVIGRVSAKGDRFDVVVDGKPIGADDREDLKCVEFLWEFGPKHVVELPQPNKVKGKRLIGARVDGAHPGWTVRGWIGTAATPNDLKTESGSLRELVILARGRLIQEDVLGRLNYSRVLGSYLTGHIEADFLDTPGDDDIATSDRQRLIEDDERYQALVKFLHDTLVSVQDAWTDWRNETRGNEAIGSSPTLASWVSGLLPAQRQGATKLLGTIRGLHLDGEDDRKELYRAGMIAFERMRLREAAYRLGQLGDLSAATLLPLLSELADLEGALYRDIILSRLSVVSQFENLVDEKQKEKLLQQKLFQNLWLLDPGWERATDSERMEKTLKRDYTPFKPGLTEKQSRGRIDIRYKTNAGEHIIVELKRANRVMNLAELTGQGEAYHAALRRCLLAAGERAPNISIVFVVGKPLAEYNNEGGRERVTKSLAQLGARVVEYEQLIQGAQRQYQEYLDKSAEVDKLGRMLKGLDKESKKAARKVPGRARGSRAAAERRAAR